MDRYINRIVYRYKINKPIALVLLGVGFVLGVLFGTTFLDRYTFGDDSQFFKKYPRANQFFERIQEKSEYWGVDSDLTMAIVAVESSFQHEVTNGRKGSDRAYGLFQIKFQAADDVIQKLFDANSSWYPLDGESITYSENNIKLGVAYLSLLMHTYLDRIKDKKSRTILTIAAYNAGIGKINRLLYKHFRSANNISPFDAYSLIVNRAPQETRAYLRRVLENQKLFTKAPLNFDLIKNSTYYWWDQLSIKVDDIFNPPPKRMSIDELPRIDIPFPYNRIENHQ